MVERSIYLTDCAILATSPILASIIFNQPPLKKQSPNPGKYSAILKPTRCPPPNHEDFGGSDRHHQSNPSWRQHVTALEQNHPYGVNKLGLMMVKTPSNNRPRKKGKIH